MNLRFFFALLLALHDPDKRALMDFYEAEIRFLRSHLSKRPIPTPYEKAYLATCAVKVGRKALKEALTLFTPDTLFRWHREAVKHKWDYSKKRGPGRPPTLPEIERLVLRLARDNPSWGLTRLRDVLLELNHRVARNTVRNILKKHGIQPAPDRQKGMSWEEFFRIHKDALIGTDFFTWEVLTPFGLVTHYVLFFIKIATREIHIAGITTNPDASWIIQVARNLTMPEWGWLKNGQIVLHDRGGQFCPAFRRILRNEGIRTLMLPYQSPNLNAYAERWVRSVKEECLERMIIVGEPMLRNTLREYQSHFHHERNHQGLNGAIPFPDSLARGSPTGRVVRRKRLGGLLNFYSREAA